MTLDACIARAVADGHVDPVRGERAQALWRELRERYRKQGHAEDMADALAAQDVKAAFVKEVGEERHRVLARLMVLRKLQAEVNTAADLGSLGTVKVEYMAHNPNAAASIVGQTNGLRRLFHKRLAELLTKHHRDLLGESKDKAGLLNIARELHGQRTGDKAAQAVANGVREAFRDMRRMFNEAGGTIGALDDWGLPHTHDALAIRKAGFEEWFGYTRERIAWHRITDSLTGRPMAAEGALPSLETQREFLRTVFENIAFGRGSLEPTYGAPEGTNLVARRNESRVLHFRTADDWIAYNTRFGSGDVYGSIISHARRMAEDIIVMRELGPSPEVALRYQAVLAMKKARERDDLDLVERIPGNFDRAERMLRTLRGGSRPLTRRQAEWARFFSSARSVLSSALLERAIIASFSDLNSMRMAAKTVGMNQGSPVRRHMQLLFNGAERETMLRAGWVADTLADPGLILARWQAEVPPAAIAERLSSGVMRAQGLAHWTGQARIAFQAELAGLFAADAGKRVADMEEPLRSLLLAKKVTDEEWAAFTRAEQLFRADNGATFASPIFWREVTDLAPDRADDLFLRIQSLVEEQTETAVPTQNVWARSYMELGQPPGTFGYELAKTLTMLKSFPITYTINQVSRIMSQRTTAQRITYGLDLVAGATVMGAVSLQIAELLSGRDPQPCCVQGSPLLLPSHP